MKSILTKFKINYFTYFFLLLCYLSGYFKNILIIFSICLIHELGHIFFIKMFKYKIVKVEIYPFGGFTSIDKKINTDINKDIVIAFGGIIFQLIFWVCIIIFKNHFNIITYNLIINYNILIMIFNLLPIIPLDGSQIVHLLLEKLFSFHLSYFINFFISLIFLILFLFINYYFYLDNYLIISFLGYKIFAYIKDFPYIKKRFLLERYLNNISYTKIDNHAKNIRDLRKNVLHYFKKGKHYVSEREVIKEHLYLREKD